MSSRPPGLHDKILSKKTEKKKVMHGATYLKFQREASLRFIRTHLMYLFVFSVCGCVCLHEFICTTSLQKLQLQVVASYLMWVLGINPRSSNH